MKSVLSIAGSDSCGGAGIQADIKTIEALGFFAQAVPTLITAQNTTGIYGMAKISARLVAKQIDVVFDDIVPQAVKVGAVGSAENARVVADALRRRGAGNIVVDPVMTATSGSSLSDNDTTLALCRHLFPLAELITPNLPEAEVLTGHPIADEKAQEQAAMELLGFGSRWVLVKGGHADVSANDVLAGPGGVVFWLRAPRIETCNTHGTGCTLSSAIACALAAGQPVWQAARVAKNYVTGAIGAAACLGSGAGPVSHMWPHAESIGSWQGENGMNAAFAAAIVQTAPEAADGTWPPIANAGNWQDRSDVDGAVENAATTTEDAATRTSDTARTAASPMPGAYPGGYAWPRDGEAGFWQNASGMGGTFA